jgi:transposase
MHMTIGLRRRIAKQTQRRTELTPETLIVALDLGKRQHAVWITDSTRVPLGTWMMPVTPQGFADLFERTARLQQQHGRPQVVFAMEPTSYFWKLAAQQITDRGARYRLVQPLSVRRARDEQRYTWAKGDRIDAEIIANLLANGTWLEKQLEVGPWGTWEHLAHTRLQLVQQRADTLRELLALVELSFPNYPYLPNGVIQPGSLAVLRACPTPAQIRRLTAEAFLARVRAEYDGTRFLVHWTIRVYHAAKRSWGFRTDGLAASVRIRQAVARYTLLTQQILSVERILARFYRASGVNRLLNTIPGLGAAMASTLVGLIGPVRRYDRSRCLVRLAGAEPTENASGMFHGKTPVSHRGRPHLRLAAYQAAIGLVRHNPEFRARYEELTTRAKHPLHRVAARLALADKLLRTIFAMLTTGCAYNASVARGEGRDSQ